MPRGLSAGSLPVYPLTEGLTQTGLRKIVRGALDAVLPDIEPRASRLPDTRARVSCPPRRRCRGCTSPKASPEAESCRNALAYEELFYFEMGVLRRARALAVPRPRQRTANTDLRDRLLARLPFSLTVDQEKVVDEISDDLFSAVPMARLLQGDVGCGKTLVALLSALLVAGCRGAGGSLRLRSSWPDSTRRAPPGWSSRWE